MKASNFFTPPLLARGNFPSSTKVGCIMNLMCWTKDIKPEAVDDGPPGYYSPLQSMLISLNDQICIHNRLHELSEWEQDQTEDGEALIQLNCSKCSAYLLDQAFDFDETDWLSKYADDMAFDELPKGVWEAIQTIKDAIGQVNHYSARINGLVDGITYFDPEYLIEDMEKIKRSVNFENAYNRFMEGPVGHWTDNPTPTAAYMEPLAKVIKESKISAEDLALYQEYRTTINNHLDTIYKEVEKLRKKLGHPRAKTAQGLDLSAALKHYQAPTTEKASK